MKSQTDNWLESMMTPEQRRTVVEVYNHFIESEKRGGWDVLDDYIVWLEILDDDQLHREADVVYYHHNLGSVRCREDHPKDKCFVPILVEAVGAILELYKDNGHLHEKNKYILQYYLAMNQTGMILMESD